METKIEPAAAKYAPRSQSLVGNKTPFRHKFHLSDGRVLDGELYKAPNARLADHLSTLKSYVSATNVCCEATGRTFEYLAINQDHIVFIEEIDSP